MDNLQGDRILIAAFVSVLVGFVTAVLSIVRLVNDKESKTTDYRQGWTDSLRSCVADLLSNINSLAGAIVRRTSTIDSLDDLRSKRTDDDPLPEMEKSYHDQLIKALADHDAHIRELRQNMYQSYALTRLHFKPNDHSFTPIENKFDVVAEHLNKLESLLGTSNLPERLVLRERVHTDVAEITNYARFILKTTWETVKQGERAYELTKRWSLIGGAVALGVLFLFAAVAALNAWGHRDTQAVTPQSASHQPPKETQQFSSTVGTTPHTQNQSVTVLTPGNCQQPRPQQPSKKASSSVCSP